MQVYACKVDGNIDSRILSNELVRTDLIFKGRNENEAYKKAIKFWNKAQLGMGGISLKKE
jgi:hypothetical protein